MPNYHNMVVNLTAQSDALSDVPNAGPTQAAMLHAAGLFAVAASISRLGDMLEGVIEEAKKDAARE